MFHHLSLLKRIAISSFYPCVLFMVAGCARMAMQDQQAESFDQSSSIEPAWDTLLQKTPITYTTPHPETKKTPIDGLYAKIDPSVPQAWQCRRCADYRPSGGIWRLQFDKGVMRIFYEVTGWRSIASYSIKNDRLYLFNDPYCPEVVGEYRWNIDDGNLFLHLLSDECSIRLRGENLSRQDWRTCDLAGVGTPGCSAVVVDAFDLVLPPGIQVIVHPGDSRFYDRPPEITLPANDAETAMEKGFQLVSSEGSIANGLNRILWWDGNWMEIRTEDAYRSFGVQFLGDPQVGWARIFFDDVEVWRGDTAAIWSQFGRHGGYVEILCEVPGRHTLRVESLDVDYRPVTVASIGFGQHEGVIVGDPNPLK